MSEDPDGRQTRPADDVGRSDGSAERATVDGGPRWPSTEDEAYSLWRRTIATRHPRARTAFKEGWWAALRAGSSCEGLRRREAPHGTPAPDASQVE